jgi:hypothetical protein
MKNFNVIKKINLKSFSTVMVFLVLSLFFVFSTKVLAATTITVDTTGYSVLAPTTFSFGGYYAGNVTQKPFTTYFEYKNSDSDLTNPAGRKETIKIVRPTALKQTVEVSNNFNTSPELQIDSIYYFSPVEY